MKSYLDLLHHVRTYGEGHADRTGVGTTSVFGYQWRHRMATGFPLLTTKKLPFRWIAEELFWFLSGSTDETKLREKGVDIWAEWATPEQTAKFGREAGNLGPVYGGLWRSFPTGAYQPHDMGQSEYPGTASIDQIATLLHDLTHSPGSRRLIVSGWHPYWARQVALPPCHTLWQCKVHESTVGLSGLSLHLYARSIDSFLGLPFNIASYGLLLSLLAHVTNMIPRDLVISFGDLHIYNNHGMQVSTQLARPPLQLPSLNISEELRGSGIDGLLSASWRDLTLTGYAPYPAIQADVAV